MGPSSPQDGTARLLSLPMVTAAHPAPLRSPSRRMTWLPPLAGAVAAIAGSINVVSTITPNVAGRGRLLHHVLPAEFTRAAHALALPVSVALLVLAVYLVRRRRRAWSLALTALIALGALNLVKGLDFEEAALSWAAAALLYVARDAFYVRHEHRRHGELMRSIAVVVGSAYATAITVIVAASHYATPSVTAGRALSEAAHDLVLATGPLTFRAPVAEIPERLGWLGIATLLAVAWVVFRPLRATVGPAAGARELVASLISAHGEDTLSFFKLRGDHEYLFTDDRRAFVAYQLHAGVMVLAGDPLGPPEAIPALLDDVARFAQARGLRVAEVGASEEMASRWADAGLKALYIGDEAVVDPRGFSLEGRAVKKIRQAVGRITRNGYTAALVEHGSLDETTLGEMDAVSARWRGDQPERGFSMALDAIHGEHLAETLVLLARDGDGELRGFLHFVPSYGRPAVSLSAMRRDPGTPNGVTEFMLVHAFSTLAERGVEEVSLNFAAFARYLHSPEGAHERLLARVLRMGNRFFQIESLYRFNARFAPRWQPRYLVYERAIDLPRTGLAALRAEGQLPKLRQLSQRPGGRGD